jgi:hypothetical protein
MKLIILSLLALGVMPLWAVTTQAAPILPASATQITAESVDFDLKSRQAVYHGDVKVVDPRINLNCEWLTATIAESGGRVDRLVAESNVVATIVTNDTVFTVKSPRAIYTYNVLPTVTNQILELSGVPEPTITWPQAASNPPRTNEFIARRILWNIGEGTITAEGHRGVFPSVDVLKKMTAPAAGTNAAAVPNP